MPRDVERGEGPTGVENGLSDDPVILGRIPFKQLSPCRRHSTGYVSWWKPRLWSSQTLSAAATIPLLLVETYVSPSSRLAPSPLSVFGSISLIQILPRDQAEQHQECCVHKGRDSKDHECTLGEQCSDVSLSYTGEVERRVYSLKPISASTESSEYCRNISRYWVERIDLRRGLLQASPGVPKHWSDIQRQRYWRPWDRISSRVCSNSSHRYLCWSPGHVAEATQINVPVAATIRMRVVAAMLDEDEGFD